MDNKINADRFSGFAGLYENTRPSVPEMACKIISVKIRTPSLI